MNPPMIIIGLDFVELSTRMVKILASDGFFMFQDCLPWGSISFSITSSLLYLPGNIIKYYQVGVGDRIRVVVPRPIRELFSSASCLIKKRGCQPWRLQATVDSRANSTGLAYE